MPASCEIIFIDVGQGSSTVILTGEGKGLVIDCGPVNSKQTIKFLKDYVQTIEAVIITHNHADHDGSLANLLVEYKNNINSFYFLRDGTDRFKKTVNLFKKYKDFLPEPIRLESPRVIYSYNALNVEVLYPTFIENEQYANNFTSAIILLSLPNRKVLFSGDSQTNAWEYLKTLQNRPLDVDIWTAPHHGGKFLGDNNFHDFFANYGIPQNTIISVGTSNQFGHPEKDFIKALISEGSNVFCTQMTQKCCKNLAEVKNRSSISQYSLSSSQKSITKSGKPANVPCHGTISAVITTESVQISHKSRYRYKNIKGFAPMCEPSST